MVYSMKVTSINNEYIEIRVSNKNTIEYQGPGAKYFPEYVERARNIMDKHKKPLMLNRIISLALALMVYDGVISVYAIERKIQIKRNGRLLSGKSLRTQLYRWKKIISIG